VKQMQKESPLAGKWTYRSFRNNPEPTGGDAEKLRKLLFAEAVFTFQISSDTSLKGAIDWEGGGLDLQGTIRPATGGAPLTVAIVGSGRPTTSTADWQYDYHAYLAHQWPYGIDQVPALVGTVTRVKPHGTAAAGYVASFIAVKQP
jgi:hypothetical protein